MTTFEDSPMPTVLISDALSETAVNIFRERGLDVIFEPKLGKDKEALLERITSVDGLAIRSATKATEKTDRECQKPESHRARRDWR